MSDAVGQSQECEPRASSDNHAQREEMISAIVDKMGELTSEQRDTLALLLPR